MEKEWGRVCQGVALARSAPGLSCSRAPALKGWGTGTSVVSSAILFASSASCSSLPAPQELLYRYAFISVSFETGSSYCIETSVIVTFIPFLKQDRWEFVFKLSILIRVDLTPKCATRSSVSWSDSLCSRSVRYPSHVTQIFLY